MVSTENCVTDAGSLHRYRTEIPNLVLDMLAAGQIDQHDLALYVVLKRTAGDRGSCWKASETLATETHVSTGQLVKAKAKLHDLGLIEVQRAVRNGHVIHEITIVNVWPENMARYAVDATAPGSSHESARSSGESARSSHESARSSGESARSSHESARSSGEPKKEPIKKNQGRRKGAALIEPAAQSGATAPEPPSPGDAWLDVKARISEMFGGLSVTDKAGTLKPHVGVSIGILGKAAGDDPVKALVLLNEYASSPDRRYCNGMYRLPESLGSWLGKRGNGGSRPGSRPPKKTYTPATPEQLDAARRAISASLGRPLTGQVAP